MMYLSEVEEDMIIAMLLGFLFLQSIILYYVSGLGDRLKKNEKNLKNLAGKFGW